MIVKKPGALLATRNCLQSLPLSSSRSSTSSPHAQQRGTRAPGCIPKARRAYASIAGDAENLPNEPPRVREKPQEHVWPEPPKGHSNPTPYQIFALQPGASYSKTRFYELVKIYHPDINSSNATSASSSSSTSSNAQPIPHAIKVERYRLIVAAHAILSDPAKRSAYDRFGAGWNGRAEAAGGSTQQWRNQNSPGPFTHSWGASDPGDPIWRNATWEDWERFYARRAQEEGGGGGGSGAEYAGQRAPVYMANSYFLAMVVALAIMGSSLNYGRAQDAGTYFVEQRDIVHDRAAKELRRVRQEASSLSSRQDRIEFFVRQREATMGLSADSESLREEKAERLLPEKEICASEELREREM